MKKLQVVLILLVFSSCGSSNKGKYQVSNYTKKHQIIDEEWLDSSRHRVIPVTIYKPKKNIKLDDKSVVIISHGYNYNHQGTNRAYSYFAENLAIQNYFVISIQHELPTDDLLPMTGNVQESRKPFWDRGANTILFVINELKIKHPELNFKKIILLGHSNGGDMSVLFAINNPNLVFKYITLDHRRVAIPRVRKPQILSLRSGDQEPDYGVIPSQEEQDKFGIKIIKLPTIIHNEMNDGANTSKKEEMWQHIINFLKD